MNLSMWPIANAVAVYTESKPTQIGYVPRYLAHDVGRLLQECSFVELVVEQLNRDAPLQQRLLCGMRLMLAHRIPTMPWRGLLCLFPLTFRQRARRCRDARSFDAHWCSERVGS